MHLKRIQLTNFRNYTALSLELSPGITVLQGANAQGKTNFLEAIYLLATARSPFSRTDQELVNWLVWDDPLPFARLEATVSTGEGDVLLELTIIGKQEQNGVKRFRKKVRINGVNKKLIDLLGNLRAVLFCPQDVEIVAGAPEMRRRFLDVALCQVDSRYCRRLSLYAKVVEQRNHLLKRALEGALKEDELVFWNDKLVEEGSFVTLARWEALGHISHWLRRIHRELTDKQEFPQVVYLASALGEAIPSARLVSPPAQAEVAEAFRKRLEEVKERELEQGVTLVGPHRDDVRFLLDGHDVAVYGSRGQQRSVALSLRLAEMEFITACSGDVPILLLDEVMAELDSKRRHRLTNLLLKVHQAIVTTTDWGVFERSFLEKVRLLTVTQGVMKEASLP